MLHNQVAINVCAAIQAKGTSQEQCTAKLLQYQPYGKSKYRSDVQKMEGKGK